MSTPENHPVSPGKSSAFDSLTALLVIVEGNEDTTVRPIPPSLRASHAAYRELLADPKKRFLDPPAEPPPPPAT
jgi:hypothetical protein